MATKTTKTTRSRTTTRTAPADTGGLTKTQATAAISAAEKTDAGADQVQDTVDKMNEKGFFGTKVDPTPNENYTVDGQTDGKPTPETDPKLRAKAREAGAR